jgi:hypothetical protein
MTAQEKQEHVSPDVLEWAWSVATGLAEGTGSRVTGTPAERVAANLIAAAYEQWADNS